MRVYRDYSYFNPHETRWDLDTQVPQNRIKEKPHNIVARKNVKHTYPLSVDELSSFYDVDCGDL